MYRSSSIPLVENTVLKTLIPAQLLVCVTLGRQGKQVFKSLQWK